jgi:hypothetical protein
MHPGLFLPALSLTLIAHFFLFLGLRFPTFAN